MSPKSKLYLVLLVFAVIFYAMEGVLYNPFSLWILSPLFVAAIWLFLSGTASLSKVLIAFVTGSVSVLSLVHILWVFDIASDKTASSTSALIFAAAPIYAFIIGGVFGLIVVLFGVVNKMLNRAKQN